MDALNAHTALRYRRASAALTDICLIQIFATMLTAPLSGHFVFQPYGANPAEIIESIVTLLYAASLKLTMLFTLSLFYFTTFTAAGGQTPGQRIFNIRVIKVSGGRVRVWRAAVRFFAFIISTVTVFGLLAIFFDRKGQGWHDKWSGTFVVNVES